MLITDPSRMSAHLSVAHGAIIGEHHEIRVGHIDSWREVLEQRATAVTNASIEMTNYVDARDGHAVTRAKPLPQSRLSFDPPAHFGGD